MKIFITLRSADSATYSELRDGISIDFIKLFNYFNITPILVPNNLKNPTAFFSEFDAKGALLTGGDDPTIQNKRYETENLLIEYSIKNKKPIFGICRGLQAINLYFGGSLKKFDRDSKMIVAKHEIEICNDLFNLPVNKRYTVNSFHEFFITKDILGKELMPFALSDHNTIEGVFNKEYNITAIQWHPERYKEYQELDLFLLSNWIKLCT